MNLNKQLHETLSQACYHLEVGDFEKVEDLLNEVSTELLKQKDYNLIIESALKTPFFQIAEK